MAKCKFPKCPNDGTINGYCRGHDKQKRRGVALTALRSRSPNGSREEYDPTFNVRIVPAVADGLAKYAAKQNLTRGVAANELLREGLGAKLPKFEMENGPAAELLMRVRDEFAKPLDALAKRLDVGRGVVANWVLTLQLRAAKLMK